MQIGSPRSRKILQTGRRHSCKQEDNFRPAVLPLRVEDVAWALRLVPIELVCEDRGSISEMMMMPLLKLGRGCHAQECTCSSTGCVTRSGHAAQATIIAARRRKTYIKTHSHPHMVASPGQVRGMSAGRGKELRSRCQGDYTRRLSVLPEADMSRKIGQISALTRHRYLCR